MTLPLGITRSLGPTKPRRDGSRLGLHLCSKCPSYSLASICPYTPHWIPVQLNLPYAHLRYLFEGYRPSQTNTVTQSVTRSGFDRGFTSVASIFRVVFHGRTRTFVQALPPMLHRKMNTHNATIQLRCMGSFRLPHN
jgi:hypothetical protein